MSSYVPRLRSSWHLPVTSFSTSLLALATWMSTVAGEHVPRLSLLRWWSIALVTAVFVWRPTRLLLAFSLCLAGAAGGAAAWVSPHVDNVSQCSGVAILHSDPSPLFGGTQVIIGLEGARLKALAHGVAASRLAQRSAGELVAVSGTCSPLSGAFERGQRVRHIVGAINIAEVSENFDEGTVVARTANRLRDSLNDGVAHMGAENKSLFTGLVIGDDRLQSREMVQRFRDSGLSHLCAASGQNVAYLLALVSPLIKRRSARTKWFITMLVIGWFIVLTRAEPSVLRAGFMAGAVATNGLRRSPMNARVVLALSVMCLLLVDPMLAWSVGFALSVGATAGLAWLSAPLGRLCGGRGVLAATLAAQAGTFPISFLVFGSVPVVSLVANPLALPVAGAVMTVGLPISFLAATFPVLVDSVSAVMNIPVAWVDLVARVASRFSPTGGVNTLLWCVVVAWVLWRWWKKDEPRPTSVAG